FVDAEGVGRVGGNGRPRDGRVEVRRGFENVGHEGQTLAEDLHELRCDRRDRGDVRAGYRHAREYHVVAITALVGNPKAGAQDRAFGQVEKSAHGGTGAGFVDDDKAV